jgi:hypothetical protein
MSAARIIALVAVLSIAAATAMFVAPAKKSAGACGDIFSRADTEWEKTCEISK